MKYQNFAMLLLPTSRIQQGRRKVYNVYLLDFWDIRGGQAGSKFCKLLNPAHRARIIEPDGK